MRFRKGNKVEVFGTKEVPSGSWYSAEIIHGNGHYYTIQYDGKNGNLGAGLFDRVSRKTIRPCPPVMQMVEDWVYGDVVEVFHSFSWKMATVLKALPMDWLLVRLVGSSHELEVLKADIRPRLCWQDDEWKVIGKGLSNGEERQDVPSKLLHNHNSQTMASTCCKNSYHPISNIASQSLKRKLTNCHSPNKAQATPSQKLRATGKDKRPNRFIPLPEKVDYVLPSRAMPVKKCMMPPINNRLTVSNKSALERQKVDDADSFASSVASCSISGKNICKIPGKFGTGSFQDNDEYNSDAESCCRMGSQQGNSILPGDEKLTDEVHRIELDAYRSTIEALHASGPLSWEQETLLTNLRDSLHITNDEHLMELRNLVSPSTCIPNS